MPKGFVSERDMDPRARDLRILLHHRILETNNRRSETWIKCPRIELHLTYMTPVVLATEFSLVNGDA